MARRTVAPGCGRRLGAGSRRRRARAHPPDGLRIATRRPTAMAPTTAAGIWALAAMKRRRQKLPMQSRHRGSGGARSVSTCILPCSHRGHGCFCPQPRYHAKLDLYAKCEAARVIHTFPFCAGINKWMWNSTAGKHGLVK